ncbi:MAG: GNAT family N-acetyltransferase [Bacteroidetes bacterium QS_9_68_14]|nr:MAG: GNAT family N-acetyltransferase [Bacteroidetes bacterium QS_9_68_14]
MSASREAEATPPGARVNVRRAERGDLGVLVRFARAMARETEDKALAPATVRAGIRAALNEPARGTYFVAESGAEDDEEAAGALMVTREWSDWRNAFFWWIQSVYVPPAWRRQGVYRRLYEHVRCRAQSEDDVCGLRLYVERENAAARAAYEALGMRETHYRMYEGGL